MLWKEELVLLAQNYFDTTTVAAVLSIGILVLVSKVCWRQRSKNVGGIPGHLGLPFVGETFSFLSANNSTRGCYQFVRLRRLWHGRWFRTRLFGKIHVFVPSAEGAKAILANDFVQFNKGYVKSMGDAVGEKSLLCVSHEDHRRIRRLLADPFSMTSLSKFVKQFDDMLSKRLQKLVKDGKSFVLLDFSMKVIENKNIVIFLKHVCLTWQPTYLTLCDLQITFDSMCNMLMSLRDESTLRQIEKDCTAVSDAMLSFPFMIPGTRYYKGIKARNRLMERLREIISRRRSGEESPEDFLQSMLQRDSYPPDQKLDDSEIMDNLLTLIIASQTTTAAAMTWSVKFLDENREAQERLREEQLSILRKKEDGELLTLEDLNKMSFGSKVVKETLRMSNVLLWFPRVALGDCRLEGFEIKKGWHVNIDATCIHYDPDLYKDPMQFNPSRFDEIQKPYSFIPFGSGPRTCLGINMAKLTMLVFLHRMTGGYRWTVDDPDPCLEKKAHIPRLRSGCPITLKTLKDGT
ncbi:abscisic acid 8'-hydroxylase 3-like isoform X1 [Cucurbita pepo subsp. pepo]|uniref:abscisic acid 8'-hydroxylase 3-like isoform X1 n=1 Tax=Cucurbita pepo subsp. pepo TaxID=3664 RepID=UPI000C9D5EEF|nr:abscisic acid 8'-hydroxylase 3-like isoform X1 [Cucurbita pepo subsp. pepo]